MFVFICKFVNNDDGNNNVIVVVVVFLWVMMIVLESIIMNYPVAMTPP